MTIPRPYAHMQADVEGPIRESFQQKGEIRQRVRSALRHTEPKEATP